MIKPESPCQGCTKRYTACQDSCEDFLNFRQDLEEYKKTMKELHREINEVTAYISRKHRS